jgi:methyl coenzyme M reductase subunit D
MGKYINKQVIQTKQSEKDKDLMIGELVLQLSQKEQRISDLEKIVADLMKGGNE